MKKGIYPLFIEEDGNISVLDFFKKLSLSEKGRNDLIQIMFSTYKICFPEYSPLIRVLFFELDYILYERGCLNKELKLQKKYYQELKKYHMDLQQYKFFLYMKKHQLTPYACANSKYSDHSKYISYSESSLRRIVNKFGNEKYILIPPVPTHYRAAPYKPFTSLKESPEHLALFAHSFCSECLLKNEKLLYSTILDLFNSTEPSHKSKTSENFTGKFFFHDPPIAFLEKKLQAVQKAITFEQEAITFEQEAIVKLK